MWRIHFAWELKGIDSGIGLVGAPKDTYTVLETLGHGSAGRVYRASRKKDDKEAG